MAHIAIQSAANVESQAASSDSSHDLGDSESAIEGTTNSRKIHSSFSASDQNIFETEKNLEVVNGDTEDCVRSGSCEDTSCSVKKKKMMKNRKENKVLRDMMKGSECHGTVKEGTRGAAAVSAASEELVEGCATDNLATSMERVNTDTTLYGRPSSPYVSSENDWEASDPSSDSDADHSDSSDDDNPKSQVDRWIDCEAIQFMDGENSNLSSETDDTDDEDDSDSDITDVSPLVSTGTSPSYGLSPAVSRRNLPSCFSNRQPFMRHYSHRGHDGDVEDEEEDDQHDFSKWSDHLMNNQHSTEDLFVNDHHPYSNGSLDHKSNMSLVVQALLKLNMDRTGTDNEHVDCTNQNKNDHSNLSHLIRRHSHNHMSPALHANPHHRHLRKHSHPRRKNMSFTNEEVRIINRDNSIMLDKLLAVHNRPERTHNNTTLKHLNKPAPATVNRKKQEEGIRKENLVSSATFSLDCDMDFFLFECVDYFC